MSCYELAFFGRVRQYNIPITLYIHVPELLFYLNVCCFYKEKKPDRVSIQDYKSPAIKINTCSNDEERE